MFTYVASFITCFFSAQKRSQEPKSKLAKPQIFLTAEERIEKVGKTNSCGQKIGKKNWDKTTLGDGKTINYDVETN